ncbi:MAG: DUF4358 domain-containing protein [Oscillospiraceae bacterium]|nr:DUF4358 domain-containing protein [Oscillospiraceae bacterium]
MSSCNFKSNPDLFYTSYSPNQIAEVIIASQTDIPALIPLTPEDDYFTEYLSNIYNINASEVKDGVIYYADGMIASEIAVFLLDDKADANKIINALEQYISRRTDAFTGYAPTQAAILKSSVVVGKGNYVALLICGDAQKAGYDFQMCFGRNPPALPSMASVESSVTPITSGASTASESLAADAYNPSAVITAWKNGDSSFLTEKNLSILNACKDTIATVITDNMDDFEKELAIHNWIINWASYDLAADSNSPYANPDPDNANPYGLLIHKKAICLGYSATFQLFMDLLDIECITVKGFSGSGDHAWNMVKIDGEWYCVDTTWDDPVDIQHPDPNIHYAYSVTHKYFNVTSDFMRETGHQWDETGVPEATSPYPPSSPEQDNSNQNQNTDDTLIQGV